ncbi:MAG: beta-lactamase family protein [Chloroflexota bacterium]|nr:beta-lactamase family protein [Chloroflexota bacterium]
MPDPFARLPRRSLVTRRGLIASSLAVGGGLVATSVSPHPTIAVAAAQATPEATPVTPDAAEQAAEIVARARQAMTDYSLRSVIIRVLIDGQEIVTDAFGASMTGVPATTDMRFRNGAVAISYIATVLLQLVDQGVVGLDDPIATWLPDLPLAEVVTLRMLTNMTSGYPDYVQDDKFIEAIYADPFRQWTPSELLDVSFSKPPVFEPGTNWNYAHTNYVILGQALEQISGRPLADLIQELILFPLGLRATESAATASIPEPVLHAFSSERRLGLGIAPGTRFYEESTFWNPSWTLAEGAIQTTDIVDMATSAEAIGTGSLLSPASHQAQVDPGLLGFGAPAESCIPNCFTLSDRYNYGLGVVLNGEWIAQNPLFAGYSGVMAYLPSRKITLAIAATYGEDSFDDEGNYAFGNASQRIYAAVGAYLAPESPPIRP